MHTFDLSKEELCHIAAQDFEAALGGMKIEGLIDWGAIGLEPIKRLNGESLAALAHDDRRAVFDKIHDIAMLPVVEKNTPQERDAAHKQIDAGVRTAKWRYTLALANDTYDLGYDYVDLEVLSPLCAQLATIERGATNPHMPTTHKLRHNPATHSVHVAGLVSDIFDEVHAANPELSQDDKNGLAKMQKQLMRSAIVHDMGELKGELSIATNRRHMSAQEMEAFEHDRGLTETEVFSEALDARESSLKKLAWPVQMLADKKSALLNDYSIAEGADVFTGRAHKVIERMQSQQDYLRFEGKDMAPPLSTVPQGAGYHKDFMEGYAREPMDGTANGEKSKPALQDMVSESENPQLAQAVLETLNARLEALQGKIETQLEYRPRSFEERFLEGVRAPSGGVSR